MIELNKAYVQAYCTLPSFTLEQAAECAYGGADQLPGPGHSALHEVLGGDEPFIGALAR